MRRLEVVLENALYDGAAINVDANIDRVRLERHVGDVESDIPLRARADLRDWLDMR